MQSKFIKITLRCGCSLAIMLHIFSEKLIIKNTSGGLLVLFREVLGKSLHYYFWVLRMNVYYKQEVLEAILTLKFVQASKVCNTKLFISPWLPRQKRGLYWNLTEVTQETVDTFFLSFINTCLQPLKTICKRVIFFEATTKFSHTNIL